MAPIRTKTPCFRLPFSTAEGGYPAAESLLGGERMDPAARLIPEQSGLRQRK
jgi:hypothetical protein